MMANPIAWQRVHACNKERQGTRLILTSVGGSLPGAHCGHRTGNIYFRTMTHAKLSHSNKPLAHEVPLAHYLLPCKYRVWQSTAVMMAIPGHRQEFAPVRLEEIIYTSSQDSAEILIYKACMCWAACFPSSIRG